VLASVAPAAVKMAFMRVCTQNSFPALSFVLKFMAPLFICYDSAIFTLKETQNEFAKKNHSQKPILIYSGGVLLIHEARIKMHTIYFFRW
jgi:predicted membrane protein